MSTSNFKNADSILSMTLRKNQFSTEENSFIGRVTRNTVTLENLIAPISEKSRFRSCNRHNHQYLQPERSAQPS